jgi:hypothetical protein
VTINIHADETKFLAGIRRAYDAMKLLPPGGETKRLRAQVENLAARLEFEQGRNFRLHERIECLEDALRFERLRSDDLSEQLMSAKDRLAKARAALDAAEATR